MARLCRAARDGGGVIVIFVFIGCGLLGFAGGLFLFKIRSRWCPQCGATTADLAAYRQGNADVR
jgi:hypothetical protein